MDWTQFSSLLMTFTFTLPRVLSAFTLVPFLSKSMLGGAMIRNGVATCFCAFLFPVVHDYMPAIDSLSTWAITGILVKEVIIGLVIGFLAAIPFWAIESVGFFIDNQRGATMASSMNPLSGSQTSPLGILLVQVVVTLFFIGGSFLMFIGALYSSYRVWPVFTAFPTFGEDMVLVMISQLDFIMTLSVLLAGPVVIAMFMSEMGLALVSKFAPQLNVFFLAMPVKSAVAMVILVIYMDLMKDQFKHYLMFGSGLVSVLQGFLT